jgi:hypothetical protein
MPSSMDKSHGAPIPSPGYETRDANVRGVIAFLVTLSIVLAMALLVSWGIFRYFSMTLPDRKPASPFTEIRQLPSGPELQVYPRQDYVRFLENQQRSLESYAWENRDAGTVRVPIERAMDLLLQKGLPVASETPKVEADQAASTGETKQ